jgi:predicted MPP superfamily phosphohydrolase
MVGHKKAKKLVEMINELKPDLVLISGDIIDDNIKVVKKHDLLSHFKKIKSTYGVYGIMGNHEYIGRSYTDIPYYENNNINMLIDSSILVDDKFYIVGRDDIQSQAFYDRKRENLKDLVQNLDKNKPLFLLDHQPYQLADSDKNGIDIHISGHTHHGQFWPFSLITGRIFEEDWGYLKKGDTHFYISSGYGTFGPPIRIGSHSEIIEMNVRFK